MSDLSVTNCAGLPMLGGSDQFSKPGGVKRRWHSLPKHSTVRIQATLHFLDRWEGEALQVMVGPTKDAIQAPETENARTVWQETYNSGADARPERNVCGNKNFGESKLSAPVDVVVEHSTDVLDVVFRNNFGQIGGSPRSWGLSNVVISVL